MISWEPVAGLIHFTDAESAAVILARLTVIPGWSATYAMIHFPAVDRAPRLSASPAVLPPVFSTVWSGTNIHQSGREVRVCFRIVICCAPGSSRASRHRGLTRQESLWP